MEFIKVNFRIKLSEEDKEGNKIEKFSQKTNSIDNILFIFSVWYFRSLLPYFLYFFILFKCFKNHNKIHTKKDTIKYSS